MTSPAEQPSEWMLQACAVAGRVEHLHTASNSDLRLLFGELSPQELRTLRAALSYILSAPASLS